MVKVRTIMIHAVVHWQAMADASLWPMATVDVVHHYSHMPQAVAGMMSLLELILKMKLSCSHFQDLHVWGCPSYVLEPKLQDGHKLPKWQPHS